MKNPRPDLADFHRKVLMEEMMQAAGLDVLDAIDVDGGQSYVRARVKCRGCTSGLVCEDWLAEHSEGTPPDFCPNADFFRTIKSGDC